MSPYRKVVGAAVTGAALGMLALGGPASASEWPSLNPQPAKCVPNQPHAAGDWCTYHNPHNPDGEWREGYQWYPAGSFASLDLCMQYQNLTTRTPYDKSWCGVTVDHGKHYSYYNLYLRHATASAPAATAAHPGAGRKKVGGKP